LEAIVKRAAISVVCLILAAGLALCGADGRQAAAQQYPAYAPRLGDIMVAVQLRHFKLWFSGDLGNWPLAGYALRQIQDSLAEAATLYQDIPNGNIEITMTQKPLAILDEAIKNRDRGKFARGFADLTATCNHCHEAAHVGFIFMRIPTTSPFGNQAFSTTRK
jgi:hypothetical protein